MKKAIKKKIVTSHELRDLVTFSRAGRGGRTVNKHDTSTNFSGKGKKGKKRQRIKAPPPLKWQKMEKKGEGHSTPLPLDRGEKGEGTST